MWTYRSCGSRPGWSCRLDRFRPGLRIRPRRVRPVLWSDRLWRLLRGAYRLLRTILRRRLNWLGGRLRLVRSHRLRLVRPYGLWRIRPIGYLCGRSAGPVRLIRPRLVWLRLIYLGLVLRLRRLSAHRNRPHHRSGANVFIRLNRFGCDELCWPALIHRSKLGAVALSGLG